jgi:hypothetical protein
MPSGNAPLVLAMVLCDHIIREAGSNKFSLIGTFNGLWAPRFPTVHPSMAVYVALSDGRGLVPCCLRMRAMETGKEVFSLKGQVEFRDPAAIAELVFQIQQARFEAPGNYSLEFVASNDLLSTRRLMVQQSPPPRPAT